VPYFQVIYIEYDIHRKQKSRPIYEIIEADDKEDSLIYWISEMEKRGCELEGPHPSFGSKEFHLVKIEELKEPSIEKKE
jgi:hypothetical protein